jgi:TonB family protein
MRLCVLFLALFLFVPALSMCQTAKTEKVSAACKNGSLEHKAGPTGPYKFLPGKTYKHSPTVKFQINEDGTVSKVKLTRSSGVKDIDKQVLETISSWKFTPVPGCTLDSEMTVLIHWQ